MDQQSNGESLSEENYLGVLNYLTVNLNGPCDDIAYPSIDMDESCKLECQFDSDEFQMF